MEVLRALSIDQQTLLALHFFEEMTGPELAEVFGVPEGTVRSRLRLARGALQGAMERLASDPVTLHSTVTELDRWARDAATRLGER